MKDINVNQLIDEMGSPDFEYIDGDISLPSKDKKEENIESDPIEEQHEDKIDEPIEPVIPENDIREPEELHSEETENDGSDELVEEIEDKIISQEELKEESEEEEIQDPVSDNTETILDEQSVNSSSSPELISENEFKENTSEPIETNDKSSEEIVNEFVDYIGNNREIEHGYSSDLMALQRLFGLNSLDMQILDLIQNYQSTEENIDIHKYVRGFINFILGR